MEGCVKPKQARNESEGQQLGWLKNERGSPPRGGFLAVLSDPEAISVVDGIETKFKSSDPKDCDLCLNRMKSEEILMEVRRDADVQIAPQI